MLSNVEADELFMQKYQIVSQIRPRAKDIVTVLMEKKRALSEDDSQEYYFHINRFHTKSNEEIEDCLMSVDQFQGLERKTVETRK